MRETLNIFCYQSVKIQNISQSAGKTLKKENPQRTDARNLFYKLRYVLILL